MVEEFEFPVGVDSRLWIKVEGFSGELYLGSIAYPGTNLDRIAAWVRSEDVATTISLSEITDASELSRVWLNGYLVGASPRLSDLYGPDVEIDNLEPARLTRWMDGITEFRKTGDWKYGRWFELTPVVGQPNIALALFNVRAEEVWAWSGESWKLTKPQPRHEGSFLFGTECWNRSRHADDDIIVDVHHMACPDCGFTTELT